LRERRRRIRCGRGRGRIQPRAKVGGHIGRFCLGRTFAPTSRWSDGDAGRLKVGAGGLAPNAGLLLDAPQRPSQPAEREDLLSFFFRQDIAHSTESKSPSSSMSCRFYWPVLRCPSLAGFGCPPRQSKIQIHCVTDQLAVRFEGDISCDYVDYIFQFDDVVKRGNADYPIVFAIQSASGIPAGPRVHSIRKVPGSLPNCQEVRSTAIYRLTTMRLSEPFAASRWGGTTGSSSAAMKAGRRVRFCGV
jgi:hypothetical protein